MMIARRSLLPLLVTLMTAGVCLAQSSEEFGRGSGGLLELSTKGPSRFSGSLGLSTGLGGYGTTLGGTIVNDRLWFFGTAERTQTRIATTLPQTPQIDANWNAALGNRNTLGASFSKVSIPSSFLSLHYTGIVSSNMFFTASVSNTAQRQ